MTYKIVHTPDYLLAIKNSNLQKDDMTYLKRKDGGYMFLKVVIFPLEEEYCKSTKQVWLQEIGKNYTQTIKKQGNKIVAYLPLTGKTLKGIPLLPDLQHNKAKQLSLEAVPLDIRDLLGGLTDLREQDRILWLEGYKAAGGYTIEDIYKAMVWAVREREWAKENLPKMTLPANSTDEKEKFKTQFTDRYNTAKSKVDLFIQSLTKYPIAIEVDESLPIDQMFKQGKYAY